MVTLTREYIAAGDFAVVADERKMLTALLGSCVGVGIFDAVARVGGMLHILLPEPPGEATDWLPYSYASSGIPLFLEELQKAGAKKDRMQAVLAGGSLWGDLTKKDLALNFGGRSTEIIRNILGREQVEIVRAETGGIWGTRFELDTQNWRASILPVFEQPPQRSTRSANAVSEEMISAAIDKTQPIPQIILKIIRLMQGGKYHFVEIAEEFRHEPVLGAKVISLCNSALYSPKIPIDSIEKALVHLGEGHVLEAITTTFAESLLAHRAGGYALCRGGLFNHAVATAYAAKALASILGEEDQGLAYTAGLLHDIGKIVLDQYFLDLKPSFYQETLSDADDFVAIETHSIGTDHQLAGGVLARKWSLPESLQEVITCHHYPEKATKNARLVHLIHLADLVTTQILAGQEVEKINTRALQSRLEFLGIAQSEVARAIDRIPWKSFR